MFKQVVDFFHFARKAEGSIAAGNRVNGQQVSRRIQDISLFVVQVDP